MADKTAFIFPGQGSQTVGMGKDFFDRFPVVQEIYKQAEDILGYDLARVSFEGPEDALKQTQNTQPALYVHSYVIASQLNERGLDCQAVAGHSLGEFSALAYAGVFSFEDGLALVKERASLMQKAGENQPGRMAAVIGMSPEDVMDVCVEAREQGIVQPANYNSPRQIVISGAVSGVAAAMELAKARGAKRVIDLPVSGAFHSPLMAGAVEQFGEKLKETHVQMPRIPVYANVTAAPVSSIEEIRTFLHHQLTHPVRWVETIQNMIKDGVMRFTEVGSGKVLSGLVKKIHREAQTGQLGSVEDLEAL